MRILRLLRVWSEKRKIRQRIEEIDERRKDLARAVSPGPMNPSRLSPEEYEWRMRRAGERNARLAEESAALQQEREAFQQRLAELGVA